ncbi:hypothetical protein PVAND_006304 [Polypedilum vanderplanki]|uniref:Uncharacterized protein n=1 Tax=Polypedilum vanderplanki TaxID=319348 RepID=A0A9J6C3N3_POLVA|nr:hypothetical protein PVAND_006304 [Polypedilum vanderplanki]
MVCKITKETILTKNDQIVTNVITPFNITLIDCFDARQSVLKYFPKNLNEFMPNLYFIFIEKGLVEIHKEDLKPFPQLLRLYLSNNKIQVLKKDLFIHNKNIEVLFLSNNKIFYVDANIFGHFKNLTLLGFLNNICESGIVEPPTNTLEKLNKLKENIIRSCSSKVILENLKQFEVIQNQFEENDRKYFNFTKLVNKILIENSSNFSILTQNIASIKSSVKQYFDSLIQNFQVVNEQKISNLSTQLENAEYKYDVNNVTSFLLTFYLHYSISVEFNCIYLNSNTCKIEKDEILTKSDQFVTNVNPSTASSITTFDARYSIIKYFPRNLSKFFPNVFCIFLEKALLEIHKEDLEQFPNITCLYLSNNEIRVLEKDVFIYNTKLEILFLSDNKIYYVDSNVFSHLKNLKNLGFSNNICHSKTIEENKTGVVELTNNIRTFCSNKEVANMYEKFLESNFYQKVPKNYDFQKDYYLVIQISNMLIDAKQPNNSELETLIQKFQLKNEHRIFNNLTINLHAFSQVTMLTPVKNFTVIFLTFFSLNSNAVKFTCDSPDDDTCKILKDEILTRNDQIVTGVKTYLKYARVFDARYSTIKYFPKYLNHFLPFLRKIFIEKALLEVHKEDLEQFLNLEELYLSNNQIQVLKKDLFIYNNKLEILFISDNKIFYVDSKVFDNLKKLKFLGFLNNICFSGVVRNNEFEVMKLTQKITRFCSNDSIAETFINMTKSETYNEMIQKFDADLFKLLTSQNKSENFDLIENITKETNLTRKNFVKWIQIYRNDLKDEIEEKENFTVQSLSDLFSYNLSSKTKHLNFILIFLMVFLNFV